MVKKIIFFCFGPVIKYHYKRFGVEILKQNGFEVWIYDFSPIISPAIHKNAVFIDTLWGGILFGLSTYIILKYIK